MKARTSDQTRKEEEGSTRNRREEGRNIKTKKGEDTGRQRSTNEGTRERERETDTARGDQNGSLPP
jgi:hypothetical protein